MVRLPDFVHKRLAIFNLIILIIFAVLLGRLWFLQIALGNEYNQLAESNRVRTVDIPSPRGNIYDLNGEVLVKNRPGLAVAIVPFVFKDNSKLIERLALLLDITPQEIKEKLKEKKTDPLEPKIIKRDVGEEKITYLVEHQAEFTGVEIITEPIREYIFGNMAPHVLGYVGEISEKELKLKESQKIEMGDMIGKSGIEKEYQVFLSGQKGQKNIEVNANGRPIRVINEIEPISGQNLRMTLDTKIQLALEQSLEEGIKLAQKKGHKNAKAGAALVMDPYTGEIKAMASYPVFDPSEFIGGISKEKWADLNRPENNFPMLNRAVMATYPPGSTFKLVTGLAALQDGMVSSNSTFVCTGKWIDLGRDWPKYCWKRSGHGSLNFDQGIAYSCDTVFYEIGYSFYKRKGEPFQEWARKMGFGRDTEIDLPSELKGRIPDKEWKKRFNKNYPELQTWFPGDTVNMAIGQGDVLTSPIQLANFYSAIINGGKLYKPRLVKSILSIEGKISHNYKPEIIGEIGVKPSYLQVVKKDLEAVVEFGTASSAFRGFPIKTGGKTGTSQVKGKDDYAWFVSFAPAEKTKYISVFVIEQGGNGGEAGALAARKLYSQIFDIEDKGVEGVVDRSR